MKRIVVLVCTFALAGFALIALAAPALAQGPTGGYPPFGGGMMGGRGMMGGFGYGYAPNQAITSTIPFGNGAFGMMGGFSGMSGYGMGRYGYSVSPNAAPITFDQAVTSAQSYLASLNNPDLKLDEIEQYAWNFYVVVKERSTGVKAFQLIVDEFTGAVYPEMGPNMMWNTKYSPMAWMVGGFNQATDKMPIGVDDARAKATVFLKQYYPNTTLDNATDTFYGYYNIDILQDGKTYGMLSVNGYTGAVWYHTWHGAFVASKEIN
jgi:hypothetical protein